MTSIYVLKLENNKYYVGKTKDTHSRIKKHFSGKGSEFTKKYKPKSVEKIYFNTDDELKYTLKFMNKYGIENVRGGPFVKLELPKEYIITIKQMLSSEYDCCFNCGKSGHFVRDCKEKKKDQSCYEKIIDFFKNISKYVSFYLAP